MDSIKADEKKVYDLHGGVRHSKLMLLPSEHASECYQPAKQRLAIENHIRRSWNVFDAAHTIVIYGHSLASTEMELRTVLTMGLSGDENKAKEQREILVVNLERELKGVVERLRPILPQHDGWTIKTLQAEKLP